MLTQPLYKYRFSRELRVVELEGCCAVFVGQTVRVVCAGGVALQCTAASHVRLVTGPDTSLTAGLTVSSSPPSRPGEEQE